MPEIRQKVQVMGTYASGIAIASGLPTDIRVNESGIVLTDIEVDVSSGLIILISGAVVDISGQPLTVSGSVVTVASGVSLASGAQVVVASGLGVSISGQYVHLESGDTIDVLMQGFYADSGDWRTLSVDASGEIRVEATAEVSGQAVDISGQDIHVSSGNIDTNVLSGEVHITSGSVDVASGIIDANIVSGNVYVMSGQLQVSSGLISVESGLGILVSGQMIQVASGARVITVPQGGMQVSGTIEVSGSVSVSGSVVQISGQSVDVGGITASVSGEVIGIGDKSGHIAAILVDSTLPTAPAEILIEEFESIAGIILSADVTGLTTNVSHRGRGTVSVEFDKSLATQAYGEISKPFIPSINLELYPDAWLEYYISLADLTNIASVRLYLGSNSTNYWYWETDDSELVAGWNHIHHSMHEIDGSAGNGCDLSNVTWIAVRVVFDAAANTLNNIRVDEAIVKRAWELGRYRFNVTSGFVAVHSGLIGVTSGRVDVLSGEIHILSGLIAVESGEVHVVSGLVGVESGEIHVISGKIDVESGTIAATVSGIVGVSGAVQVLSGELAVSSGEVHILSGNVVVESGTIDAAVLSGEVHILSGLVGVESGEIHIISGKIDVESGTIAATVSGIVGVSGVVQVLSGELAVSSGIVGVASGEVHIVSGIIQIESGVITIESGLHVWISGQHFFQESGAYVIISGQAVRSMEIPTQHVIISGSPMTVTNASGGLALPGHEIDSVTVKNQSGNAIMWLGGTEVGEMPYVGYGFCLAGSEAITLDVENMNDVKVCSAVNSSEEICFIGVTRS